MKLRSTGFTLIELLVVIAIIAILAAILFPIFSSAQEAGRKAYCASSVGELSRAMLMYSDTNNGKLPPYDYNPGSSQATRVMWYDMINPYIKTKRVILCPSLKFSQQIEADAQKNPSSQPPPYNRLGGFGVSWPHVFWDTAQRPNPGLPLSQVIHTSRVMMLCDTAYNDPKYGKVGYPVCYCKGCFPNGPSSDPQFNNVADRHSGFANCAFADGHVRAIKRDDMLKPYTATSSPVNDIWGHLELAKSP